MIFWVLVLMTAIRVQYAEALAPWADTYTPTAAAIATKCESAPLPGGGKDWCAMLLVEMSWHESRFNQDVSHDGGHGYGLFGTQAGTLGRPVPADPEGQVDAAIELLKTSWRICAKHPLEERLGWYAAGGTGCERRLELSVFRMHEAAKILRANPLAVDRSK
jgi:hypothetical protein